MRGMRGKGATKKKKSGLLLQHLEDVSWRVLDDYRVIVRDMIRGRSGVYALYNRRKLYYVGLASNLMGRLKTHLKDRHDGEWDRFSVYLTEDSRHIKELESLLLRIAKPEGNRQGGNFSGARNLLRDLDQRIRELEADRRAILLGGHVAKRRLKSRVRRSRPGLSLSRLSERRIPLRALYKGKLYRATLRKDGTFSYQGKLYSSPSAAGRKIVGRSVNGLWFWNFKNNAGEWVKLTTLKT